MNSTSDKIVKTILAHLKDEDKMDLIAEVVDGLKASSEYKKSRHHAILTSATALDATSLKGIRSYLDKSIGDAYELEQVVDDSLVAGFTLQINDTFIDASVLGKINAVSNILTAKE